MQTWTVDQERLREHIADSAKVVASLASSTETIARISEEIISALKAGHKLLVAGNGGSAAEALHLAEELTGRFKGNRVALPAIALPADCTALTCIGNDYGFDAVFSRQVEAFGTPGDVLVLFTTSGKSRNLVTALEAARARQMKVICLLGKSGGDLAGKGDHELIVKSNETARIQESHQVLLHLILDAVEEVYVTK